MDIEILKSWGSLIAVFKPQGFLTIPGRGHKENIPVLSHELGKKLRGHAPQTLKDLFVVHRLDEGTSGAILFALTPQTHKEVSLLFEEGKIKKTYLAIVEGNPKSQIIDAPIFKLPSKKNKSIVDPKGKPSQTIIKNISTKNGLSLLECVPLTGRSHQIRVHLSHIGCPLLGDTLYGGSSLAPDGTTLKYPCLHALKLEFYWPDQELKSVVVEPKDKIKEIILKSGFKIDLYLSDYTNDRK